MLVLIHGFLLYILFTLCIESLGNVVVANAFIIHIQSECIEKYQIELFQNMMENLILTSCSKSYLVAN